MLFNRTSLSAHAASALLIAATLGAAPASATQTFTHFESGQVRPLALSPNGDLLFATNTPDNRLEIYRVTNNNTLVHLESVPVGLEPVAVAARSDQEVWVVNHLSDSVSVVAVAPNLNKSRVVRTLLVGDEPRDIVFAGASRDRAFITTAHRGQNVPYNPQFTTPGVGRADVWVYDAANLTGTPANIIRLFTDTPRALAVSPDGATVYAAGFASGNQTTSINEFILSQAEQQSGMPIMPPPTTNHAGVPMPPTGLIVRFNGQHWIDELGRPWDDFVKFNLPDKDVFAINANANPPHQVPGGAVAHVGTVLFNMAVNPVSGKIYVSNQEASNEKRFEGPGIFAGHTVRAQHYRQRVSVIANGQVSHRHLNKHVNYNSCCAPVPNAESVLSMAMPTGMAVSADGSKLFVAATASSKVGVYSTAALENDTFSPNHNNQIAVSGGGPTGVILNGTGSHLFVLTRFDNSISILNIAARQEVSHIAMHNPEPSHIRNGRRFLYDASLSSKGDSFCASCHMFGDKDELAWDLGNPDEDILEHNNPIVGVLPIPGNAELPTGFITHKGPMTTQSLRGMANHGPMHWRGDRTGSIIEPNLQPDSGAYNEREAFRQFQAGFVGLLGRSGPLSDVAMNAFTDFILDLSYPPNPIRNLDDSLTSQQAAGRNLYFNRALVAGGFSCNDCHTLDPAGNAQFAVSKPGFFGTSGGSAKEVFPQIFKVPQLRNLYTKIGKFGFFNLSPFIETTQDQEGHLGDQIRGFGGNRGGDFDGIFRFMKNTTFSQSFLFGPNPQGFPPGATGDTERRQVEQFLLAYDSNLKPIVGQQITLANGSGAAVNARVDLLIARANAGDCDLVAKGVVNQQLRGLVYLGAGTFKSDSAAAGNISAVALRAAIDAPNEHLTFTCTPLGSGVRIGIDRDLDGVLDADDPTLN